MRVWEGWYVPCAAKICTMTRAKSPDIRLEKVESLLDCSHETTPASLAWIVPRRTGASASSDGVGDVGP